MNRCIVLPAALLVSVAANAETVYRCDKDGKPYYSEKALNESCRRLDLPFSEPSAEEMQRIRQEQQRKEALRQAEQEREWEERKVRAEEDAARAAERQARAAEVGARYQRDLLKAQETENLLRNDSAPTVIVIEPVVPQRRSLVAPSGLHPQPEPNSHPHPGADDKPAPKPSGVPPPRPQSPPALNIPARLP